MGLLRHGKKNMIYKFHKFTFRTRVLDAELSVA
jgi:hypothetical protein